MSTNIAVTYCDSEVSVFEEAELKLHVESRCFVIVSSIGMTFIPFEKVKCLDEYPTSDA